MRTGLAAARLPETAVQVLETADRAAVGYLVAMPAYVDVIVPRGGKSLIARISEVKEDYLDTNVVARTAEQRDAKAASIADKRRAAGKPDAAKIVAKESLTRTNSTFISFAYEASITVSIWMAT